MVFERQHQLDKVTAAYPSGTGGIRLAFDGQETPATTLSDEPWIRVAATPDIHALAASEVEWLQRMADSTGIPGPQSRFLFALDLQVRHFL
jgi:hypothetical protein